MKELTRKELPEDGTHFVVTWVHNERDWADVCCLFEDAINGLNYQLDFDTGSEDCTNIRYWQFPEGETK